MAELKKLAQHCEYGATLPQMLRDRLVCGVKDDQMKRRLSEVELTFEKALTVCQAMESANKNVRDLQGLLMEETGQNVKSLKGATAVHRVHSVEKKGRQKDIVCYRCKGQHAPEECKFLNELCHKYGKRGHIKRACKAKQTAVGGQKTTFKGQRGEKGRRTYPVREEESNETEDTLDINTIYSVSQVQRFSIPVLVPPRSAYFVCYSYRFRCLFYSNVSALRSGHHWIFHHDSSSKRTIYIPFKVH